MQTLVFDKSPLTLQEFTSLNWKYLRKTRKSWFIIPTFLLVVFSINSCNILVGTNGYEESKISDAFWPLGIFLLFFGFLYYSFVKESKKSYFSTPALAEGLAHTLSEESITIHGNSMNGIQGWAVSFKQAVKIGKWILLSSSGTTAYFLDTEKLVAPATITDVGELLLRKGIKLKE